MKLRELIRQLQAIDADLVAALGESVDPEIVAAIQPSYPLTAEIDGAAVLDDDEDEPQLLNGEPIVYLATSGHPEGMSPYAPRAVWGRLQR